MSYATTCTKCGCLYSEQSSEASNEPDRKCGPCERSWRDEQYQRSNGRLAELERMTVGQLAEDLACYGFPQNYKLSSTKRDEVIDFARSFEECSYTREELAAMDDQHLVGATYWAMADYARGQI